MVKIEVAYSVWNSKNQRVPKRKIFSGATDEQVRAKIDRFAEKLDGQIHAYCPVY